jgi:hypothetical protein
MNYRLGIAALLLAFTLPLSAGTKAMRLFDGKTFQGWNGDTNKTWRIAEESIVGGTLKEKVPHNEFICTDRQFTNFVLRLKFKLIGTNGFVNGGVQFRSQRVPNHFEASGYQADIGDPSWWGSLYDESRRNKVLVQADSKKVNEVLKRGDWNDYEIRCDGNRIQLSINGLKTVDYIEPDASIPGFGIIGLQVHGGGETEASYKDIFIEEFPSTDGAPPMLTFSAQETGYFAAGSEWKLISDRNTQALLTVGSSKPKEVSVPKEKLEDLAAALEREGFFQLQNNYGDIVPDGSERILTISHAAKTKTLKLHFLPNISDPKLIEEAKRATRIWILVRGLFEDDKAVDSRPSDKQFLEKK